MRVINNIVLHCSATEQGKDFKASDIDRWHKKQGWSCIGYHYVIDIDGTIEPGRPESRVGAHVAGKNTNSIGIVYIGGLVNGKPVDTRTNAQKKSMLELVNKLLVKYHLSIANVHCHNQYANKACPCFKIDKFKAEYEDYDKK